MAIVNPFSITYGSREVGGSTSYQLHGPYVIDKSATALRLVFDVIVVATSHYNLKTLADALEDDFRKRDQDLEIDLSGSTWTYTEGTDILNVRASITKSGSPDTDQGFSRAYTCTIEAELPADDTAGLRDVEVLVDYEPSRQQIVTMRGTYTALSGTDAVAQYKADFDTEAGLYLTLIDTSATFELVDESYSVDRNKSDTDTLFPHVCNFTRQYVQLLVNQTTANLDSTKIRDHRVIFTDLSQHPGDSKEKVYRVRRVVGSYDCAIDIDVTTDLYAVFEDNVKPQVIALFETNFAPKVFAIEDHNVSYDETTKRMAVRIQFLYQKTGGDAIVEVSQSVAFRESRHVDYTPVHDRSELASYVDPGFAVLERVWTRTVVVIGTETPKLRIAGRPASGNAGLFGELAGQTSADGTNQRVVDNGWTVVSNHSQVTPHWIGDPDEQQVRGAVLTETVVERYAQRPANKTGTGGVGVTFVEPTAVVTPRKG